LALRRPGSGHAAFPNNFPDFPPQRAQSGDEVGGKEKEEDGF